MTAVLVLRACGGSVPAAGNTSAGYDAALNGVVNPSNHRGGTIIFDDSGAPDSTDPGNTYLEYMWNLVRLYGRTLVTYRSAPGAAGLQLVPDLRPYPATVAPPPRRYPNNPATGGRDGRGAPAPQSVGQRVPSQRRR